MIPGSLESLCQAATRTEWAASMAAGGELECTAERDIASGLAIVHVRHPAGEVLALAVQHGPRLRIVAGLAAVDDARDVLDGATVATASVTRVSRHTAGGWPFVSFEVHSTGTERDGLTTRDDLVVCLHRPEQLDSMACVERVGLRVTRDGVERASATAALDASGELHVSLVSGTWRQLHDDGASPPSFDDPSPLVPIPSRVPDVNVGHGDYALPELYVDQWRAEANAAPPALRQITADTSPTDGSYGPGSHEPDRTLDALCARAGAWLEERLDYAICELAATDVEGLFLVDVRTWMSADTFVAVGDSAHLRVVARVGRVWTGPTRSGGTRVLRVHQRATSTGTELLIETETSLIDHDLGVLAAYGFEARHATACLHDGDIRTLRCGARIPLSYEPFTQTLREVVVPASFPFAWREQPGHASHAVVAFGPHQTLRVTLRDGDWEHLAGELEHNPLPVATPVGEARRVIVPVF